jgi:hypothetical protein
MKTATKELAKIQRTEEGEWLHLLLADIQREIAEQPGPGAVGRIRAQLFAKIGRPERAAA